MAKWPTPSSSQLSLNVEYVDADDTDYYTDAPLPSPANTPYRTPILSRKSSYNIDPAFRTASPPNVQVPHPHNRVSMLSQDSATDETISLLDPRRFTPTLHANLVAEILSLRRDLESKSQFIDSLENDLSKARQEQENATTSIASAQREAREVKKRLQAAENDTSIESIIQERDDALEANADLRRQVERLAKSRRVAEDEIERTRKFAERDVERWEEVKRGLERRAHVAESRLRKVLEEVELANAQRQEEVFSASETDGTDVNSSPQKANSDTASIRTISRTGYRPQSFMAGDDVAERFGVRFSHLGQGLSLADELNLPEESEEETEPESMVEEEGSHDELSETDDDDDAGSIITPVHSEHVTILTAEMAAQTDEPYPEIDPSVEAGLRIALELKNKELEQSSIQITELKVKITEQQEQITIWETRANETATQLHEREEELTIWEERAKDAISQLQDKEEELAQAEAIVAGNHEKLMEQEMRIDEISLFITSLKETNKVSNMATTGVQAGSEAKSIRETTPPATPPPPPPTYTDTSMQTIEVVSPPPSSPKFKSPPQSPPPPRHRAKRMVSSGMQTMPALLPRAQVKRMVASGMQTDVVPILRTSSTPPQQPKKTMKTSGVQTEPMALPRPPTPPKKVVVSLGVQTEQAPSPPLKIVVSGGIQTEPMELPRPPTPPAPKIMISSAVQTDSTAKVAGPSRAAPPAPLARVIPKIQIVPPPMTPPLNNMPRFMKRDIGCQTAPPPRMRTVSIQTESLASEAISALPQGSPPSLLPSALPLDTTPLKVPESAPAPPVVPRRSSKRVARKEPVPLYMSPKSPIQTAIMDEDSGDDCFPPPIKKGKGKSRDSFSGSRSIRGSALFNDFMDTSDEDFMNMSEGEYKTILTAPKPRKNRNSRVVGHRASKEWKNSTQEKRRSGVSSNGQSVASAGPPFPVPARFSSRKVTPSGAHSGDGPPLPRSGLSRTENSERRKPSLRKSRSATTLSTKGSFTREPGPSSFNPDFFSFDEPMMLPPTENRPITPVKPGKRQEPRTARHQQQASRSTEASSNTATTKQTANPVTDETIQQTSVVEAIAQTMVGEWMWKYVRRRKPFGGPESPPWDGRDDTAGGQRHKRWVWLAPYERAVMWSSKQPTSGNALLGKSGRKLAIQSVLDVKDDTPLPRGASPTPIFNRSILILTPQRALKFTAATKERHYLWLTALSFLAQSAQEEAGMLSLPPPMPFEYEQVEQQQSHVAPTRIITNREPPPIPAAAPPKSLRAKDSIRVAKNRKPEAAHGRAGGKIQEHVRNESGAEPPSVPRWPGQQPVASRQRANTGNRPPAARSFTTNDAPSMTFNNTHHVPNSNRNSVLYGNGVVGGIGIIGGGSSIASTKILHHNNSFVSSTRGGVEGAWGEPTVGTMRMEAFVDRVEQRPPVRSSSKEHQIQHAKRQQQQQQQYQHQRHPSRTTTDNRSEIDGASMFNVPSAYQIRKDREKQREEWSPPTTLDFYGSLSAMNGTGGGEEDFFSSPNPFRGF